jgi:uncharacterized membrane protein
MKKKNLTSIGVYSFMALTVLVVNGCVQKEKASLVLDKQNQEKAYVYECADDMHFVTQAQDAGIWIFLPDKTLKLFPIESASGTKFSASGVTFLAKGEEAQLSNGKRIYRECKINRQQSIWETAKLNGVDFRAIGNEPGWYLELRNAETIKLAMDYGATISYFKTPEPVSDQQSRKTQYKTSNDEHVLVLTLEGKPCQDTMSDENFATTVVIRLDDKEYMGCGRALH